MSQEFIKPRLPAVRYLIANKNGEVDYRNFLDAESSRVHALVALCAVSAREGSKQWKTVQRRLQRRYNIFVPEAYHEMFLIADDWKGPELYKPVFRHMYGEIIKNCNYKKSLK